MNFIWVHFVYGFVCIQTSSCLIRIRNTDGSRDLSCWLILHSYKTLQYQGCWIFLINLFKLIYFINLIILFCEYENVVQYYFRKKSVFSASNQIRLQTEKCCRRTMVISRYLWYTASSWLIISIIAWPMRLSNTIYWGLLLQSYVIFFGIQSYFSVIVSFDRQKLIWNWSRCSVWGSNFISIPNISIFHRCIQIYT